jgi:hypothetical protein
MGWGDEVMVTGQVRVAHERDPGGRRVRVLDRNKNVRAHALWEGNRTIVQPGQHGDFLFVVNGPGARPYIAEKLAQRWVWKEWEEGGPPRGEIFLSGDERDLGRRFSGRIVLEPTIKAQASPNKAWGWVRWNKLAWLLQNRGHKVTQLGPIGTPLLDGAELVVTNGFREACAVLSTARAAVLPEGGLHHAAAALRVPAVVIFGGFIAPIHTGYADQVNLFTGGEACGMRVLCGHCIDAMKRIPPELVAERLMEVLRVPASRYLAA